MEELLKPRIKLIAPIPKIFMPLEVGMIWEGKELDGRILFFFTHSHAMDLEEVKKYPHLFNILHWSEDRKLEEMPEYVKVKYSGEIAKVHKWKFCVFWTCEDAVNMHQFPFVSEYVKYMQDDLEPASEEEYEQYRKY